MSNLTPVTVSKRRPNDVLEHALLSTWLDTSDVGMCVLDEQSQAVMLNAAACSLLGLDGLSMLNEPLKALFKDLQIQDRMLVLIQTPGFEAECQASRVTSLGKQLLLIKFRSVRVGEGPRFKMLSITDITGVTKTIEHEAERRQWQAMNAGVVISDARAPDMPVVYVNTFFENMSGYSFKEMVGRNCRHLQGQDQGQPAVNNIRLAIRNQTNGYAVLRNYRKDGSLFVNELFVSPIKDETGQVTHFMGIQHLRDSGFAQG